MGKYSAKGKVLTFKYLKLYLTTARIVFVSNKYVKDNFKAFDIPVAFLYNEKF